VRQFIAHQIESVAQLETLLLLRRDSQRQWGTDELAQHLYISEKMCRVMLDDLEKRKYLVRNPLNKFVRYECSDARADAILAALEGLYRERRVAIVSEIYSKPVSNVQTFADAFRLRKDEQP
jgi:hypothetical protein